MRFPREAARGLCAVLVSVGALGALAGCGGDESDVAATVTTAAPAMHVAGSDRQLRSLLRQRGVRIGRSEAATASSARSAWDAFKSFAAIPVVASDLDPGAPSDMLLYEYGVFDWGNEWGKTFELSFVRQYITPDGDLQQVHLVVHYPESVGRGLGSSSEWSSPGGDEQWLADVESSAAFDKATAVKPLGFEVWQESAE